MALEVKNPPANAGDLRDVGSVTGLGRSPVAGHGNLFQVLAWKIPWSEEPGRVGSIRSQSLIRLKRLGTHTAPCM